jgi:hypothetical protein
LVLKKPLDTKYFLLILCSPFSRLESSLGDLSGIYVKTLEYLSSKTGLPIDFLKSKILLEIIDSNQLLYFHQKNITNNTALQDMSFELYNRCSKILDLDTIIPAPYFAIENILQTPVFSFENVQNGSPLLILEPDRLIHVCFGYLESRLLVIWSDSFGEWKQQKVVGEMMNFKDACSYILDETISFFGENGFAVRLCISYIDGWSLEIFNGILLLILNLKWFWNQNMGMGYYLQKSW